MENEKKKIRGVKISTFNGCMILLSFIVFLSIVYSTMVMPQRYHQMVTYSEDFIDCEKSAVMLLEGSDYLTEQVRLYTANTDVKYMNNYFEEALENKRREKALVLIQAFPISQEEQQEIETALQESNELMEREIYAMRLVATACGETESILPQQVREVSLSAEDRALSRDEMLHKARTLVFDENYQDAKAHLDGHLKHVQENIMEDLAKRLDDSEENLEKALSYQQILVCILFVIILLYFAAITLLIIRPLSVHIKHIKENAMLHIMGSYEFKYLALTYNDIYEMNAANEAILTYKAEHDPLTGLMNRRGFEKQQLQMKDETASLALALIDVDHFKLVNDTYGHETGDEILKKVASVLETNFHDKGFSVRLGGDEFAVVISDIRKTELKELKQKMNRMNEALLHPADGLPAVSLSAGIAFSSKGFHDTLYSEADAALYYVKENGRCGCNIYEEQADINEK